MRVSIITVVYNGENTIVDTIQSVSSQSYSDIEYIVIDGDSTDSTLNIVNSYKDRINVLVSEPDKGVYDAMNKGIAKSSGEIIGILNADDIFASHNIIEEIVKLFKSDKALKAVYGNIEYFENNDYNKIVRYWKTKTYYPTFFEDGEVPPHPSLFVRKEVYDKIGTYYPHFKIASDHEFMFRMLKVHGYKSFYFDTTIVKMRIGGVSTSGFKSYVQSTRELIKVWKMNGYQYPMRLYFLRPFKKIKQLILK